MANIPSGMQAYLNTVQKNTGKTWEDFKALAQEKGLAKHGEILAWLKSEFGLGHGHATAVTHVILSEDKPEESDDDGIAKHFTGNKAGWRAAYDALAAKLGQFGPDVKIAPAASYLNLQRGGKKFGIVQVSGKRLDIGIKLKGTPAEGRFAEAGSWNAMVTHRVQIEDAAQIDGEVLDWLRRAYDQAK